MRFKFVVIEHTKDFETARKLFREYADSLNFNLCFQNFEKELSEMEVQYNKPSGGLILIFDTDTETAIGCAGVRKFEDGVGELKRMYVQNVYRGEGLGKALLNQALALAQTLGYKKLRLDTLNSMETAIALYRSTGFYEMEPYRFNPDDGTKYFEIEFNKP